MAKLLHTTQCRDSHRLALDASEVGANLDKEWLLSNRRGSYASGTVLGCNTRRYHGLLVGSLHPPVQRWVTLSNLLDTAILPDGTAVELSTFEFADRLHPDGFEHLEQFSRDVGVHFTYNLCACRLIRSVYLAHDRDVLIVRYAIDGDCPAGLDLTIMPLAAMRDFHSSQSSSAPLEAQCDDSGVVRVSTIDPHGPVLSLHCPGGTFDPGSDWWYSFRYRAETRRGLSDTEDVWVPGTFGVHLSADTPITLLVSASSALAGPPDMAIDPDAVIAELESHNRALADTAGLSDSTHTVAADLLGAADQFIVHRQVHSGHHSVSILAGFHWFADWGRDTFIALPGLLLSTGRFDETRGVLSTFGAVIDAGMIPNRFDDYGGDAHYNSVDASLWFIQAAYAYLQMSQDAQTFMLTFRPVIAEIINGYTAGTRFGIRCDDDGLITAGDADTQLTWMDARCNDVSFTPRHGKAVEINALWINALHIMAATAESDRDRQAFMARAAAAESSFNALFWNPQYEFLNDCIAPDGTPDASLRPNQIFAVSLPFSPLVPERQRAVVHAVQDNLLTPYGLRSLSPRDARYRGFYGGDAFQRDSAYHQGTVWAFLIGPFVEAYLKVNDFSDDARTAAAEMLAPLLEHLMHDACLGSVSEIFDGDWPHRPAGCIAQAWSVAELLRALKLVHR